MFLFQRLIGVSIYAVCVLWFYMYIPRVKGLKLHLTIYCFLLGLMGFFYVPLSGSDLGRVQLTMKAYAKLSLEEIVSRMMDSSAPLGVLYYHLIGHLGDERLLPFINALLTYGICFSILLRCQKSISCKVSNISLVLLFFMSRGLLMMTIANIRTMLSLAIVGYAIYLQLAEKQPILKCLIIMLVGAFVHNVGMLATILFMAFYIISGAKGRKRFFTFVEMIVFGGAFFIYGGSFVTSAAEKGIHYLTAQSGYFYVWEMILSLIVIITTLFLLYVYKRKYQLLSNKCREEKICFGKELMQFQCFVAIICFTLIFVEFNSGMRLSWLVAILDMPVFLIILENKYISREQAGKVRNFLKVVSSVMLFLACSRGDLCSLKFV